ncbi:MAG: glycosyltransferase family 2 protein, partial [Chloroflexota bacterium]
MPYLSIVIPAYNEEKRLLDTLQKVAAFLNDQDYEAEVIIVENGSSDATYAIAKEFSDQHAQFSAVQEIQSGKGRAVQRGMLEAKGDYRFMCDADLSMPIEEITNFLPPNSVEDIVIGSREAKGAVRYDEPSFRHIGGRMVSLLVRLLALPGLNDTQCGFKIFSSKAAMDVFPRQTIMGWSFDIEVLFIARRKGYTIKELAIPWYYREDSHVEPLKDAVLLAMDIFRVRWQAIFGQYDQ